MNSLVSVLMPVYNGEKYLCEAIESILNQSFKDFEFLIINDGSTDKTEEIILSYKDLRIKYIKNDVNLKLIATLNKGIELSNGKYIARMDADDISKPERLEKQFEFMESNPEIGICGTWFNTFNDKGIIGFSKYSLSHDEISLKHLYQIQLSHGTAMIRKSILNSNRLRFNSEFVHAEDYDLFTKMSLTTRLANLPFTGYLVRQHENEVSFKYNDVQKENSLKVRKRLFNILHTDVEDIDLLAYEELNHQNYKAIKISTERLKFILEAIIIGNEKEKMVEKAFLENQMKILWLNYCYHKVDIITYRNSKILFSNDKLKEVNKIKWWIKSFINK